MAGHASDGDECIAVCAGMGKEAAARACAIAAQGGPLTALVSMGWAGALSCGMQPGNAYVVNEVVDGATGERFATSSPPRRGKRAPLRLVTMDHVVLSAEKRRLGESYQAVLVDMEAAAVARFARGQGIAFYCLKAVSDAAGEMLPDFSRYTDDQGHLQLAALLAHVAIRPKYWPGLARMGKNGEEGAVAMAAAMAALMAAMLSRGISAVMMTRMQTAAEIEKMQTGRSRAGDHAGRGLSRRERCAHRDRSGAGDRSGRSAHPGSSCGICGTDLKKIHTGSHSAPRIFGHETVGTIAAVGDGVEGIRRGRPGGCLPPHSLRQLATTAARRPSPNVRFTSGWAAPQGLSPPAGASPDTCG